MYTDFSFLLDWTYALPLCAVVCTLFFVVGAIVIAILNACCSDIAKIRRGNKKINSFFSLYSSVDRINCGIFKRKCIKPLPRKAQKAWESFIWGNRPIEESNINSVLKKSYNKGGIIGFLSYLYFYIAVVIGYVVLLSLNVDYREIYSILAGISLIIGAVGLVLIALQLYCMDKKNRGKINNIYESMCSRMLINKRIQPKAEAQVKTQSAVSDAEHNTIAPVLESKDKIVLEQNEFKKLSEEVERKEKEALALLQIEREKLVREQLKAEAEKIEMLKAEQEKAEAQRQYALEKERLRLQQEMLENEKARLEKERLEKEKLLALEVEKENELAQQAQLERKRIFERMAMDNAIAKVMQEEQVSHYDELYKLLENETKMDRNIVNTPYGVERKPFGYKADNVDALNRIAENETANTQPTIVDYDDKLLMLERVIRQMIASKASKETLALAKATLLAVSAQGYSRPIDAIRMSNMIKNLDSAL